MSGFKAGFVGIVGAPNAGKSTLLNCLLETRLAIVSDKPQTTRKRITGILNLPEAQIVFVDAPGFVNATTPLNEFLSEEAKDVVKNVDVIIAVLSVEQKEDEAKALISRLRESKKPFFLVMSKFDLLVATQTPRSFRYLQEEQITYLPLSAKSRPGEVREELIPKILAMLPESPRLFDEESYTPLNMREMAAEIIREQAFECLHEEVPYGLAIRIREFKETDVPIPRISAEILVDKESHKGIVIGAGGQMLKKIGSGARKEIEKLIGEKVFLELTVIAKPGWARNRTLMKELGYVVPE